MSQRMLDLGGAPAAPASMPGIEHALLLTLDRSQSLFQARLQVDQVLNFHGTTTAIHYHWLPWHSATLGR